MNEVDVCCLLPLLVLSDPIMKLLPAACCLLSAICCRYLLLSDPEGTLTILNLFYFTGFCHMSYPYEAGMNRHMPD
jgi:hypothetical protein